MREFLYRKNTGEVLSVVDKKDNDPLLRLTTTDIERGLAIFRSETASLKTKFIGELGPSKLSPQKSIIRPNIVKRDEKKIVFLRTHESIGDLVSITSAIQAAKKQRPNVKIAVRAPLPARSILENHPDIDQLLDLDTNVEGTIIDLSHPCPCGEYETAMRNEIDRSRNEIFTLASGFHWEKERPRLYLSEEEKKFGFEFTNRNTNKKAKIGVCLRTTETWKDWPFVEDFISLLNSQDYEVYAFDKSLRVENAINVTGKSIREIMAILVRMDYVICPDTAIFHLCDALDVPCIALFGSMQTSLHENKYVSSVSFLQGKCKYNKPPCMYDVCGQYPECMKFEPEFVLKQLESHLTREIIPEIAVVRMKGLGDIIMMVPMLYALKNKFRKSKISVITSKTCAHILQNFDFVDNVIVSDYKHTADNLIPPPPKEANRFHRVVNLINAIDFEPIVYYAARPDNFANVAAKQLQCDLAIDQNFIIPDLMVNNETKNILLEKYRISENAIGCQIFTDGLTRTMNLDNWVQLADNCPNNTFIWFSNKFVKNDLLPKNVINTSGELTIEEFIHGIACCKIFICPDSSGMHIAPLLNIPTILLAGSTKIEYHSKYNKSWLLYPIYTNPKLECSPCFDWQVRHDCYRRNNAPWCLNRIKLTQIKEKIEEILCLNIK